MLVKLKDIATYINGKAFKPSEWVKSGLPIIRIQNLNDPSKEYNYYDKEVDKKYIIENGDILISWSATLDIFEWKREKALLNQHIFKVVFDKDIEIDKNYFKLAINSVLHTMGKYTHGSTMKHIVKKDFENIKIPLPPLEQQKAIAKKLDKAKELIELRKASIEKLDELSKAIFVDMFGDPVENPMGWKKTTCIQEADCIVPGRDKPKSFTGTTKWITTNDLQDTRILKTRNITLGLTDTEISTVKAKIIPKGSVIFTCVGKLGICSIIDDNIVMNQQLHSFQCKKNLNNIFLMFNISYQKPYMYKYASQTTVPYMNKTVCNSIPLILPPIDLQNKFAKIIQKIEAQKALYEEELEKLEYGFEALLSRVFSPENTNKTKYK